MLDSQAIVMREPHLYFIGYFQVLKKKKKKKGDKISLVQENTSKKYSLFVWMGLWLGAIEGFFLV